MTFLAIARHNPFGQQAAAHCHLCGHTGELVLRGRFFCRDEALCKWRQTDPEAWT